VLYFLISHNGFVDSLIVAAAGGAASTLVGMLLVWFSARYREQ
jgi:ABC-type Fe3+ transport system permease subunit